MKTVSFIQIAPPRNAVGPINQNDVIMNKYRKIYVFSNTEPSWNEPN